MKTLYIITGSSSGIGLSLAETILGKAKGDVLGLSRRKIIHHANYNHLCVDFSKSFSEEFFKELTEAISLKKYDNFKLINNAGVVGPIGKIGSLDANDIEEAFYVNTISPFNLSNFLVKHCSDRSISLEILNISTGASVTPIDGWSAYCSSKAALKMLTEVWKKESEMNPSLELNVQEFSPGVIDTPMQFNIRKTTSEQFSRAEQFRQFKEENQLESPQVTAEKIIAILDK